MKSLIVFSATLMFLVACVTPNYDYKPTATEISEPPFGETQIVSVGDAMVREGIFFLHDAIYVRSETKIGDVLYYKVTRGYFLKVGEDDQSEFYLPSSDPDSGRVIEGPLVDPFQVLRVDRDTGELCGVTVFNGEGCTDNADFVRTTYPVADSNSYQQTLIYNGKIGDKINIGYREFSNNFARPAFNNDVEYDLSESRMIAYKGCRIEVIEATNVSIEYRVLSYFSSGGF